MPKHKYHDELVTWISLIFETLGEFLIILVAIYTASVLSRGAADISTLVIVIGTVMFGVIFRKLGRDTPQIMEDHLN